MFEVIMVLVFVAIAAAVCVGCYRLERAVRPKDRYLDHVNAERKKKNLPPITLAEAKAVATSSRLDGDDLNAFMVSYSPGLIIPPQPGVVITTISTEHTSPAAADYGSSAMPDCGTSAVGDIGGGGDW